MKPAIYLLAFLLAFSGGIAGAFEPWNIRLWPGVSTSPMVQKVGITAEMTYEVVDSYGWNGWESVVARSLDTGSIDPDSLGNALNRFLASENRGQISIRKAQGNEIPDMRHYSAQTAFVEAKCGGTGFYTACVYLLSPIPTPAYYKAANMIPWSYTSQAAVVRHETFHAIARACDQYRGGCPRTTDGVWESTVVCTGNPDTLMDCGGAARTVTSFDYETFKLAYAPSTGFLQVQVPPPCDPCWNGERWVFSDGWSFLPNNGCGEWFDPINRLAWTVCDPSWNARWSPLINRWVQKGATLYDPATNIWYGVP